MLLETMILMKESRSKIGALNSSIPKMTPIIKIKAVNILLKTM